MNRLDSYQPMDLPLMKINQLINSVFGMSQSKVQQSLQTCSKIVGQLLQNQLISHLSSIGVVKLLCYQIILMVAQENSVENRPKLQKMQNVFANNKVLRFSASMRNTLASINQSIQQIIYATIPKKRGGTEKNITNMSPLYQNYQEFKHLMNDFEKFIVEDTVKIPKTEGGSSSKKPYNADDSGSVSENEALIEQMEEMLAKKQKLIKKLNEELQQTNLEIKSQEDLINELQNRNMDLREDIKILNIKISQMQLNQGNLQNIIQQLQKINKEKQLSSLKTMPDRESNKKTIRAINKQQRNSSKGKKQVSEISSSLNNSISDIHNRTQTQQQQLNFVRRMLMIQAISIEALI